MSQIPLAKLQQILSTAKVLISFSGPFSHSVIEELGMALRRHLEEQQMPKSALMDLFSVFIEQSQNVRDYTAVAMEPQLHKSGIVIITQDEGRYAVSSGNLIRAADAEPLTRHIEHLNKLDSAGLRTLYKEVSRRPLPEEKGRGAGLGLITIARTVSGPLEYVLSPVDDEYHFFSLKTEI